MLKQGVISPVTVPTEWCSGMVPVLKPDGRVRICVDLTQLNQALRRQTHPMMSVDESLANLGKSKIFTKLDANSSFWQLPLCEESKLLTTFITPFGTSERHACITRDTCTLRSRSPNCDRSIRIFGGYDDGRRRPVCYASRSLTDTEKRYAVIEKEALAATCACEKFREYVMGLSFTLETDHKLFVPLLKSTELAKMPPRIQRFRMRQMRYSPEIEYVPGKQQTTPEALSRASVNIPEKTDVMFLEEVEHYATTTVTVLPASEKRLQDISTAQKDDEVCAEVRRYCHEGWPAFMA